MTPLSKEHGTLNFLATPCSLAFFVRKAGPIDPGSSKAVDGCA